MWNGGTMATTGGITTYVIYTRPLYTNGSSTATCDNFPRPPARHHVSKAERRFEEELEKLKGDTSKLLAQLRAREATKKAASDKASRGRRPHPSTGKDLGRRLQTYDAAMAARQVVRSAP